MSSPSLLVVVWDDIELDKNILENIETSISQFFSYLGNDLNVKAINKSEFPEKLKKNKEEDYNGVLFLNFDSNVTDLAVRMFFENSEIIARTVNSLDELGKALLEILLRCMPKESSFKLSNVMEKYDKMLNILKDILKDIIAKHQNLEEKDEKDEKDIKNAYHPEGFHQWGHDSWREVVESFERQKDERQKDEGKYFKYRKRELAFDLSMCLAYNPSDLQDVKILVIDDKLPNDEYYKNYLDYISKILGVKEANNAQIFYAKNWEEWLNFDNFSNLFGEASNNTFWELLSPKNYSQSSEEPKELKKLSEFSFIVVDLLYERKNYGNLIIRNLVKWRNIYNKKSEKNKAFYDIFVVSWSKEIEDVRRALDEGAVAYIPKDRILQLPAYIAMFEKYRKILKDKYSDQLFKHRNFYKIYRLPELTKRLLQTTFFLDLENCNNETTNYSSLISKKIAYDWIKELPKAELHFHIGGAMDDRLIAFLSLNNLRYIFKNSNYDLLKVVIDYLCECYFNFLNKNNKYSPVLIFDAWKIVFLSASDMVFNMNNREKDNILFSFLRGYSNDPKKLKKILENKTPEDLFFDWIKFLIVNNEKENLGKNDLISIFNVCMGIISGLFDFNNIDSNNIDSNNLDVEPFIWLKEIENLKKLNEEHLKSENLKYIFDFIEKTLKNIKEEELKKIVKDIKKLFNEKLERFEKDNYFRMLLKAESRIYEKDILDDYVKKFFDIFFKNSFKEEIDKKLKNELENWKTVKNLRTYLRPGFFSGAALLRCPENICIAIFDIAKKLVEDKVRYIEIRIAPSGYTGKGLTTREAVECFLKAADFISIYNYLEKGEFIQINYIITGKKGKSPDKLARDIASLLLYRETSAHIPLLTPSDSSKIQKKGLIYSLYPSRVVGIDLAGEEAGTDLANYIENFLPIFQTCSFVTIHAGEEESAQYIWNAIYKLHADRIGHGLRLIAHDFLPTLVRDRGIGIELCPMSNSFTNPSMVTEYPIYDYIIRGIPCIINTDDPVWNDYEIVCSGFGLSLEYVKAAELFYCSKNNIEKKKLTLWEILRLIKNSFKFAFLEKERKGELLRAVEEEIYNVLLKLEKVEHNFRRYHKPAPSNS